MKRISLFLSMVASVLAVASALAFTSLDPNEDGFSKKAEVNAIVANTQSVNCQNRGVTCNPMGAQNCTWTVPGSGGSTVNLYETGCSNPLKFP